MSVFHIGRRAEGQELMDDAGCSPSDLRSCLQDLEKVNRLSFGYRPTLAFLEDLRRAGRLPVSRPLRILDIGSGYGDGLRAIARWGARRRLALDLTGVDANPQAVASARERGGKIAYVAADVFTYRADPPPDLILSALFVHHLEDAAVPQFLTWMEARARLGWFVNDLQRHAFSYHGFKILSRLAGWHRFVRHDGPLSIARAFREEDWLRYLQQAGIAPGAVMVRRWFPYRLCLARVRDHAGG